jgi:superfamily II DNA/RNA helicase
MVAAIQAGELELDNVRHLILDEADRLLDKEFLDQTQEIVALCTHPQCQKAVFSATLPANAETIALGMLNDPIRVVVDLSELLFLFFSELLGELTTPQRHSPPEHQTNAYIRRPTRSQAPRRSSSTLRHQKGIHRPSSFSPRLKRVRPHCFPSCYSRE